MNGELPLIAVGGSGAAMLAGLHIYEHREAERMRRSRKRWRLQFPAGLEPLRAFAALDGLSGLPRAVELVAETVASDGRIEQFVWIPEAARSSVVATLTGVIGSLGVTEASEVPGELATLSLKVFVPTPFIASTDHVAEASRSLLSGLAGLGRDEEVAVRWALVPGGGRRWQPTADADVTGREVERAWRRKLSERLFAAAGLVLVHASSVPRARQLARHVESSLRSRHGLAGQLRFTASRGSRRMNAMPKVGRSSGTLTSNELIGGFLAWPMGSDPIPGLEVGGARRLAVPRFVSRTGLPLLVGADHLGRDRPVALSRATARLHTILLGETGSGKTTTAQRMTLAAMAEGIGGIYLDPKDGVDTLLDHVPAELANRVVVLDPARVDLPVVGLDLFGEGDPVLRSDVILSVLRGVSEGWGSRIDRYLRIGLRSLSVLDSPVLLDWLRLYYDPAFRRFVQARITDPIVRSEWQTFEQGLSNSEQRSFIAPATARITDLLSRPAVRGALSQPGSRVSIERLLGAGKWLVVALSPGTLGEPASRLLGATVAYLTWAAIEKRAAVPESQRPQSLLVMDEIQTLSHLGVGLETAFERFRSLHCGVVAATQAASRLSEPVRQALFANAGTLVVWKSGADEAARLSRELPPLSAGDLMSLGHHEVGARVHTGSRSVVITGRTEPLGPPTGMAEHIRRQSAERYGRDREAIEQELRERMEGGQPDADQRFGRTGRAI
jgi:hypothetical protein